MLEVSETRAAILLLHGNAVQPEGADFRPKIPWELIALVDFVGARRDLVAGEIVHRFANGVRRFAEVEVEHPMRVGDHGRRPPGEQCCFSALKPYSAVITLSRREHARKGPAPYTSGPARLRQKLSLALARATGCNSFKRPPSGTTKGGNQGATRCMGRSTSLMISGKRPSGTGPIRLRSRDTILAILNCSVHILSGRTSSGCARLRL